MTYSELLQKHQATCQECRSGFCTPATFLVLMAEPLDKEPTQQ